MVDMQKTKCIRKVIIYTGCDSGICQLHEPLGIEDGRINDNHITASTEWASNHGARYGRLNRPAQSGTTGGWSAGYNNANQWIQANLGDSMLVTGVKIQGRADYPQWVTQFKVQYSNDGSSWKFVQQTNNQGDMIFVGNTDHTTVVSNCFPTQVTAAYIRLVPTAWHGHISLRFEVVGCDEEQLHDAVIRFGMHPNRSNLECGAEVNITQINSSTMVEIQCDACGRYLSVHLPDTSNGVLRICELLAYVDVCPTHTALPSCAAIRDACYSSGSGTYEIDPDGPNNGVEPFTVQCDMNSGVTMIGHDSEGDVETPPGFETPGSYIKEIVYQASIPQITSLIDVSTHCEQYIKYECYGAVAYYEADVCRTGWPIENRAGPDGNGYTMVSPDKPFLCSGQVTRWTYQGKASRSFRAIVFRPVMGSVTQFQIVGINDIPAGAVNTPVNYIVPENERITVTYGDVIGWSFGGGVITYNGGGSYNVRWVGGNLHASLVVDQILNINDGAQLREYSIEATVESFAAEWNVWWESRDGQNMCNFANVPTETADCISQPETGCDNGGVCNCITNDDMQRYDEGVLVDKSKLPVTKIHSGGTGGGSSERVIFTLGALKCSG
ncbi:uncharacterized protein [Amphiura filiformis]|uniref:uncharacterized protein n=1 Tax=Amphiura filiformis TaxID=82378 RepID=UPI003B21ECC1